MLGPHAHVNMLVLGWESCFPRKWQSNGVVWNNSVLWVYPYSVVATSFTLGSGVGRCQGNLPSTWYGGGGFPLDGPHASNPPTPHVLVVKTEVVGPWLASMPHVWGCSMACHTHKYTLKPPCEYSTMCRAQCKPKHVTINQVLAIQHTKFTGRLILPTPVQ